MVTTYAPKPVAAPSRLTSTRKRRIWILSLVWVAVYFASLFSPPLLDDADATHAQAAAAMARTGDFVTLYVNGIRYLEKAALPYWLVAVDYRIFGLNAFATHLPLALGVAMLAALAYRWGKHAISQTAGFYASLATLTTAGIFLFTRIFIPEVLLSFFLCAALYCLLRGFEKARVGYFYGMWIGLALAVMTKGLIGLVFPMGATAIYLAITGEWRRWRELRLVTGGFLFLAIAAPWHILAGLRNTGGMNGHGFFWFYFINEHVLRFLGERYPKDYNKLPGYLFWLLHLVWLFPWSLFLPVTLRDLWTNRSKYLRPYSFHQRSVLLLGIYAAIILVFFSISTNQEYYTFPAYLPILLLIAFSLARREHNAQRGQLMTAAHVVFAGLGFLIAGALFYGLWSSRNLPFEPSIGDLLAHRAVGDYTLSMSHFFDLTGASFAALRLPAALAMLAFAFGPAVAWNLRLHKRNTAAFSTVAFTTAFFLIAAHIALVRFGSMLSCKQLADTANDLVASRRIEGNYQLMLYGDQSYGSSVIFYTNRQALLVEGRSSSLIFGSTFPDAPHIFLSSQDLLQTWGQGVRHLLFVPEEHHNDVEQLLKGRYVLLKETSGNTLLTDRPLD